MGTENKQILPFYWTVKGKSAKFKSFTVAPSSGRYPIEISYLTTTDLAISSAYTGIGIGCETRKRQTRGSDGTLTDDCETGTRPDCSVLLGRANLALVLGVVLDGNVGDLQVEHAVIAVAEDGEPRKTGDDGRVSCSGREGINFG